MKKVGILSDFPTISRKESLKSLLVNQVKKMPKVIYMDITMIIAKPFVSKNDSSKAFGGSFSEGTESPLDKTIMRSEMKATLVAEM